MSVLSNPQLLKDIKKDKKLLISCYKLDKTLKTAQVYMHKNSKYLDNNIFIMLFEKIAKNTDKILPNKCKITKPFNLSYTKKNNPVYCNYTKDNRKMYYKPMQYKVKNLFIRNTSKTRKICIHIAKLKNLGLNYQDYINQGRTKVINRLLKDMGELSTRNLKLKGDHERNIEHYTRKWNHLSVTIAIIGLSALLGNYYYVDSSLMFYGGLGIFITFCLMASALFLLDVSYSSNHLDTNTIAKDSEITESQFTVIINYLMSNNNRVIDKTFKNLSLCRKDYHLNLSPEEHLKNIKNNGTSWNDAIQKANE